MWFLNKDLSMMDIVMQIMSLLLIIFLVLPFHEFAHGWMASKLGDNTAKYSGRLTLNPIQHIDPAGAVMLLIFGIGWAKPVPVNPRNFKNPKAGMAITALAGPVSNLLAAFVGAILLNITYLFIGQIPLMVHQAIQIFFLKFIGINIALAVFNFLPIPPLDGSRLLQAFLPDRILMRFYQYERWFMLAVIVLLFTGVLDYPLSVLNNYVWQGVLWLADLPFQLFQ